MPSKTKSSTFGKTPRDPLKSTKRKEIVGQAILTSELPTMDTQKKHRKNELNTKTQKPENKDNHSKKKRKKKGGEKSETHNRLPRKRKRKGKEEHTLKKCSTNWKRKIAGAELE